MQQGGFTVPGIKRRLGESAKKCCGYESGRIGLILPDPDRHPAVQFDPGTGNTITPTGSTSLENL